MRTEVRVPIEMLDLLIIGAGPAGISAAYESKKHGLDYLVIEKGLIGNTIYNYPIGLTVFSTTNELEFHKGDLKPAREKPTREELLNYYVRFALDNELNINTAEQVLKVERLSADHFKTTTDKMSYESRKILFAIGAMDFPRRLDVPGEDLPKVKHRFSETFPYVKKNVVVIGGGNSAGEAALFLSEVGAHTTLATFRKDWEETNPKHGCIKHWVKKPLEEQLAKNCLEVFFLKRVVEIRGKEIVLEHESGEIVTLPNDFVFVLIGAEADLTLLKNLEVSTQMSKYGEVPVYNPETFETNVSGIYVVGHFTHSRHIAKAIAVPKKIIPLIAKKLSTMKHQSTA